MADVYMHARFMEELDKEFKSDIDLDIAFLGSQGPDPIYYTGGKEYRRIADDIHRYRTRDFFKTMVNYVKENNNKTTFSFLLGFISHYVMDAYIHPYVYYKTGLYDKNDPTTKHLRGLHMKFERSIDCLLIKKELNIPSRKLNLTKKYCTLKEAPKEVNELMYHTLKQEYKIENGYSMYENSSKAMYKTLKYLVTDRFGIKKLLLRIVDLFNRDNDLILSDVSFFNHLEDYDYHNDSHNIWRHPITGEEYTTSITEIFEQAKEYALNIFTKVNAYINQNKQVDLDTVFTDLSFNTGVDCKYGMNFKYVDIYNKKNNL